MNRCAYCDVELPGIGQHRPPCPYAKAIGMTPAHDADTPMALLAEQLERIERKLDVVHAIQVNGMRSVPPWPGDLT